MPKHKRWTDAENRLLLEMSKAMSVQEIYDSGKLPNRTFRAIQQQLKKLGADYSTKQKFSFSTKISEAEIVGLERVVRKFVDAFNKICDLTEFSKEDLERFRIVFSAARIYFDLYFKLQKFEEVEARVERVEKMVEQLAEEKSRETSQ